MATESDPVVVEQRYSASLADVWRAMAEKDQMRQWFFEQMTEFEPKVGFETQFTVHCEGTDFLHQWKVIDVDREKRIAYEWCYGGYPGDSVVTWDLSEEGDVTKLTLTQTGQETFQGHSVFSRENGIAGWSYFLQESLKAFLSAR